MINDVAMTCCREMSAFNMPEKTEKQEMKGFSPISSKVRGQVLHAGIESKAMG